MPGLSRFAGGPKPGKKTIVPSTSGIAASSTEKANSGGDDGFDDANFGLTNDPMMENVDFGESNFAAADDSWMSGGGGRDFFDDGMMGYGEEEFMDYSQFDVDKKNSEPKEDANSPGVGGQKVVPTRPSLVRGLPVTNNGRPNPRPSYIGELQQRKTQSSSTTGGPSSGGGISLFQKKFQQKNSSQSQANEGNQEVALPTNKNNGKTTLNQASSGVGVYSDLHSVDHNLRVVPPPSPKPKSKTMSTISSTGESRIPPPPLVAPKTPMPPPRQENNRPQLCRKELGSNGGKALPSFMRQQEDTSPLESCGGIMRGGVRPTTESTKTPSGPKRTSFSIQDGRQEMIPAVTPGPTSSRKMGGILNSEAVSPFPDEGNSRLKGLLGGALGEEETENSFLASNVPPLKGSSSKTAGTDNEMIFDGSGRDVTKPFEDINVQLLSDIRDLEDQQHEIHLKTLQRNKEFAGLYLHALQDEASIVDLLDQTDQACDYINATLERFGCQG